jgi:hypothetical protein
MASNARLYQEYVEVLASGAPVARILQIYSEVLSTGTPHAQVYQIYAEVLATSRSSARCFQEYVEVLSDPSTVAGLYEEEADNTINLQQSVEVNKSIAVEASSTITLTSEVIKGVNVAAENELEFTQDASYTISRERSLNSLLIPFQTVSLEGLYNRSAENTIALSQSVSGFASKPTSNTLVLTHTASAFAAKAAYSEIALNQTVEVGYSIGRSRTSTINLNQTVTVKKTLNLEASSILAFVQNARGTRLIEESVSSTIPLDQDLVRTRYNEATNSLTTLTQTVSLSVIRNRSVSHTIELTQTLAMNATFDRSVSNTITFNSSFAKPLGDGTYVTVPELIVVKIRRLVTLRSDTQAIVLPTPEFNDFEGSNGTINIKRSMNGDRRVYVRASLTSRLNYSFVIDRRKAIELRNFVLNNNSNYFTLENWKGELWRVQFTNNPFSFSEVGRWEGDQGNRSTVTLEFEGVRIN